MEYSRVSHSSKPPRHQTKYDTASLPLGRGMSFEHNPKDQRANRFSDSDVANTLLYRRPLRWLGPHSTEDLPGVTTSAKVSHTAPFSTSLGTEAAVKSNEAQFARTKEKSLGSWNPSGLNTHTGQRESTHKLPAVVVTGSSAASPNVPDAHRSSIQGGPVHAKRQQNGRYPSRAQLYSEVTKSDDRNEDLPLRSHTSGDIGLPSANGYGKPSEAAASPWAQRLPASSGEFKSNTTKHFNGTTYSNKSRSFEQQYILSNLLDDFSPNIDGQSNYHFQSSQGALDQKYNTWPTGIHQNDAFLEDEFLAQNPHISLPGHNYPGFTNMFLQNDQHSNFPQPSVYEPFAEKSSLQGLNGTDQDLGPTNYTAETNGYSQSLYQSQTSHPVVGLTSCRYEHFIDGWVVEPPPVRAIGTFSSDSGPQSKINQRLLRPRQSQE